MPARENAPASSQPVISKKEAKARPALRITPEREAAALSFVQANGAEWEISDTAFGDMNIHIHVPAGSIPKDGPSAGVTMATALVSVLSGRPARHDVAMTGEITLAGRVLPIGGVKEKVLGATRAGITSVLLPRENLADLEDLSASEREVLTVHAVDSLSDVVAIALRRDAGQARGAAKPADKGQPELVAH